MTAEESSTVTQAAKEVRHVNESQVDSVQLPTEIIKDVECQQSQSKIKEQIADAEHNEHKGQVSNNESVNPVDIKTDAEREQIVQVCAR